MRKGLLCAAAVCLTLTAQPLLAGVVYVPVVPDRAPGVGDYETQIWITNDNDEKNRVVETLLLPTGVANDDVENRPEATKTVVPPNSTVVISIDDPGNGGLLEISGGADLAIHAELRPRAVPKTGTDDLSSRVPVIASSDITQAGDTIYLQGWRRNGAANFSDLSLVNLGFEDNRCVVEVRRANGTKVGGAILTLPAVSHVRFRDGLLLLGEKAIRDVHSAITCENGPAYAYLTVHDTTTGRASIIEPSRTGASALRRPDDEAPPPEATPGAVSFARGGWFHCPTLGAGDPSCNDPQNGSAETALFNVPVPKNTTFSKITLEFDMYFGGWSEDPGNNHSVFWLHRGFGYQARWQRNIFGYCNAFGPNRSIVKLDHNVDQTDKRIFKYGTLLEEGTTYHVSYTYESTGRVRLVFTDKATGAVVLDRVSQGRAPVRSDDSGFFMIYFGHEHAHGHGPERPGNGWKWGNLLLEFHPG